MAAMAGFPIEQGNEYQYQTVNDASLDIPHKGRFLGWVQLGGDEDTRWFLKFGNRQGQTWIVSLRHIVEIGEVCEAATQRIGPHESPRMQ